LLKQARGNGEEISNMCFGLERWCTSSWYPPFAFLFTP
jgi:hypothetical protein